jgi:hypothetical protein
MQDNLKFTQIVIFGLKICHLATLLASAASRKESNIQKDFFWSKGNFSSPALLRPSQAPSGESKLVYLKCSFKRALKPLITR